MIPNSATISIFRNKNYQFTQTGCTEFPSGDPNIHEHISLGIYTLLDPSVKRTIEPQVGKLFGNEYSIDKYLEDYVDLLMEIFGKLNTDGKTFFSKYTIQDLCTDAQKCGSGISSNVDDKNMFIYISGFNPLKISKDSEQVIGIRINCHEIRAKVWKSGYARCRKVQLAHTALRYIYSSGYMIPIISVKLWKDHGLSAWDALYFGTLIKYGHQPYYNDFGDLYNHSNMKYVSEEDFQKRFFDEKLNNSVMEHFKPEENYIRKHLDLDVEEENLSSKLLVRKMYESIGLTYRNSDTSMISLLTNSAFEKCLLQLIETSKAKEEDLLIKNNFKFIKKLFKSAVVGAKYEGYVLKKSRLKRIIFKDENETPLSILPTSKYIEIL
jgi:hypothetical protein